MSQFGHCFYQIRTVISMDSRIPFVNVFNILNQFTGYWIVSLIPLWKIYSKYENLHEVYLI